MNRDAVEHNAVFRELVENALDAVLVTQARPVAQPGPKIVYANQAFCRMSGYALDEILGRSPRLVQGPGTGEKSLQTIRAALEEPTQVRTELLNYSKDGREYWIDIIIIPIYGDADEPEYFASIQRDITEKKRLADDHDRQQRHRYTQLIDSEAQRRRRAERQAQTLSVYDELTGLPKMAFFRQYLENALAHARQQGKPLATAMLTLLDLEAIRQIAGWRSTEELLKLEAEALARAHRGFSAYLGQGRFGFVFEAFQNRQQALSDLHQLVEVAAQPFTLEQTPLEPHAASGIAFFPGHGEDGAQLYHAAELALITAREERRAVQAYDPAMEPDPRNLTLMSDLGDAIQNNVLNWVLQPKYSVAEARIVGAEMLVRWQHPRYGWLPPNDFIPLAEKTGVIKNLTRAAIREAIRIIRQWGAISADWQLSVNVSGNDLADPAMTEEIIERLGRHTGLLTLEVTETAVMRDVDAICDNVTRLQAARIKVSMDDYGIGYSSLANLRRLHFDELKIDMSFVRSMLQSAKDQSIVRATIDLGHDLGAKVVAEGVEDLATARYLADLGCDILQGYGIGKPMPLGEFMAYSNNYQ